MMASLFLVFVIALVLIGLEKRLAAMTVALVGLLLALVMFWHHVTDIIDIRL